MKSIIFIALFFVSTAYSQCINQEEFNYSYIFNKNEVLLKIERKDKQNFKYFKNSGNDLENTKFWFEVKKDEITLDLNLKPKSNIEWFYHLYDQDKFQEVKSTLSEGHFVTTNKIKKSFNIESLIKSTLDYISYPDEVRKIKFYTVLFHDNKLNCSYFESENIEIDFFKINNEYKRKNIFKP